METQNEQARSLAIRSPQEARGGLIPSDLDGLWRMAQMIFKGGFAPKGYDNPEAVAVAIQMGMEVGLSPMQAIQNIAVINKRPSIWGDGALGLVYASGLMDAFEEYEDGTPYTDGWTFYCKVRRHGSTRDIVRRFSWLEAKKAGLTTKEGPWKSYPQRMMQMRPRSWALRDGFADVLKGLSVREEVQDIIDVTPEAPTAPPDPSPGNQNEPTALPPSPAFDQRVADSGFDPLIVGRFLAAIQAKSRVSEATIKARAMENWTEFEARYRIFEHKAKSDQKVEDAPKKAESGKEASEQGQTAQTQGSAGVAAEGPMIACPDGPYVLKSYCETICKNRQGCPSWEDQL